MKLKKGYRIIIAEKWIMKNLKNIKVIIRKTKKAVNIFNKYIEKNKMAVCISFNLLIKEQV